MQSLKFLQYFFYIATRWSPRLAWHIIKTDIKGEKKYGIKTTGADDLTHMEKIDVDISNATIYMPVSYDVAEHFFSKIDLVKSKHFIDIGSGKGRAICIAAQMGARQLTGIEFSPKLFRKAEKNINIARSQNPRSRINLINNDAFFYVFPDDTDVIFLYNPFNDFIMEQVVNNLIESIYRQPRKVSIIYINPECKHVFLDRGFIQTYSHTKLKYLEGIILENVLP